jgi:hypothetical protein
MIYIKKILQKPHAAKREFSAVALLFSFAFSRTVVYHGIDNG